MLALHGTGVSSGIALGTAHVLRRQLLNIPQYNVPKALVDKEIARFHAAIENARAQLERVRTHIPKKALAEATSFIDAHLLILADEMIAEVPARLIKKEQMNAEWALSTQSAQLREVFAHMSDPYLRSRMDDIDQVVDRVLRNLIRPEEVDLKHEIGSGEIIVAHDLTPADTVMLKHNNIKAFVTDLGGPISHTAILARSLGIPAIVSTHAATTLIRRGDKLIVDGKRGVIFVDASATVHTEYRRRKRDISTLKKTLEVLRQASAITRDHHRVSLMANIELPADTKAADKVAAEGIGLYRTEFLFMNRSHSPSEDEQFRAYKKVVKAMNGRPVTLRTLDLGADKQVDGGATTGPVAVNPALGLRAVRLCLSEQSLFRPQLRAILRAAAFGPVKIMIPMLSTLAELFQTLEIIDELKTELRRQGRTFGDNVDIGGMIEVPAAAISADLFAPHLDFLSIGTNDLIQYTLAIDRVDDAVNYLYDPLHPAVLRLIDHTLRAGQAANIPVSMCGEMAGDSRYTRLLLGMGLTEFSMHPATLLEIKQIVRESEYSALKRLARKVLKCRSPSEMHALVDAANEAAIRPLRN